MYSEQKYGAITQNFKHAINENLGKYTSYGVGGNCDIMFFPQDLSQFRQLLTLKKDFPVFVLGNGSDVLVSDDGFHGIVINTSLLNKVVVKGNLIKAECGVKISDLVKLARDNSLSGLEFAVGIPAFVGGAVCMNAGCFNKSVSSCIAYVVGENGVYNNKNCNFDYRSSRFSEEAVLEVGFVLKSWDYDTITAKIEHYKKIRQVKSPKGKSCGSVFKNEDYFAGKLIDEAGLKGYTIGGATVSVKHANYVITSTKATSQNIYDLISYVKKEVYKNTGILMQEELKYIGEFNAT